MTPVHTAASCSRLDGDFGWQLGSVFRRYAQCASAALAELPGGARGYQVLAAAETGGAGTQLALAARMGVDRTVMTYLLDELEEAGLVERTPDPADRRARRIGLTPPGAAQLASANKRLRRAEEQLLATLSPDERHTFRQLLSRIAGHTADGTAGLGEACTAAGESS